MFTLKSSIRRKFMDYVWITVALAMYTFGWMFFMLPYKIVTAGVTGISAIVLYAWDIPVNYTYLAINFVLAFFGLKVLGWRFMTKTVYAIVMLTFMLGIGQDLVTMPDGSFYQLMGPGQDFISIIIGCCFTGTALAICFLHNGSTGGTDIVAAVVTKYKNISIGRVLIVMDCMIILSSYPLFHDWRKIAFGLVTMAVENFVLDYVMNARRESVQFMIFSRKYQELANVIGTKMDHGVTILDGHGWYTGNEVKVLCILAKKREQVSILRIIKAIDPQAFVSVGQVAGVYGEGFDAIKGK